MRKVFIFTIGGLMLAVSAVCRAEDPVYFADANLKAAVEAQLGITNPTPTNMLGLTSFFGVTPSGNAIFDITGLEYATNLTYLNMGWNNISDISAVSGLTNLTYLNMERNYNISNISAVSGLTNLTHLDMDLNNISNISAVSGLTNLTYLDMYWNNISDISAVSGLTNLTHLDMGWNNISDISAVSGLTNLTTLWLDYNISISDISAVSGLTNLTFLWLDYNNISNISALSQHTNLSYLYLYDNPLNSEAYYVYIPLILSNNPGISLSYNPNPYELDLIVDCLTIDKNPIMQPRGATISCTIKNQGDIGVANFWLRVMHSTDDIYDDPGDIYIAGRQITINLGPGATKTEEFNFNSEDYSTGDFYLVAKVDATDIVSESLENNNTKASDRVTIIPFTPHTVQGYVKYSTGQGFGGVQVNLTGDETQTDVTQNDGWYNFDALADGSFTITAVESGCTFTNNPQPAVVSGAAVWLLDMIANCVPIETISKPGTPTGEISPVVGQSYTYNTSGAT